jgi:thioredoxin 1
MNIDKKAAGQAILTFASLARILFLSIINPERINAQQTKTDFKVTFIELGSVRCIPCQKMQGVMKSIEKNYGKQVKIIFYDIWTPEGKPFAQQYGIDAIPTQVFLDEKGKEFFRHEGYFPQEELVKVLKTKGVK